MVLASLVLVLGQAGAVDDLTKQNGDVNADGAIDLTDAVYTLNYLFSGGPPPAPLAPCPAASALPDSGQSKCYGLVENLGWYEVPCDQATCAGQDGAYTTGCPNEDRFEDNGDGTVTDGCTGLMWQKNTADVNANGQVDDGDRLPWCDALAYCEGLSFVGREDWQLPNVRELQSIVDYGTINPSIDPAFNAVMDWYWSSSTSAAGNPSFAWGADFFEGFVDYRFNFGKDALFYVRAVRSGP